MIRYTRNARRTPRYRPIFRRVYRMPRGRAITQTKAAAVAAATERVQVIIF